MMLVGEEVKGSRCKCFKWDSTISVALLKLNVTEVATTIRKMNDDFSAVQKTLNELEQLQDEAICNQLSPIIDDMSIAMSRFLNALPILDAIGDTVKERHWKMVSMPKTF
jgi:hypothetical protein